MLLRSIPRKNSLAYLWRWRPPSIQWTQLILLIRICLPRRTHALLSSEMASTTLLLLSLRPTQPRFRRFGLILPELTSLILWTQCQSLKLTPGTSPGASTCQLQVPYQTTHPAKANTSWPAQALFLILSIVHHLVAHHTEIFSHLWFPPQTWLTICLVRSSPVSWVVSPFSTQGVLLVHRLDPQRRSRSKSTVTLRWASPTTLMNTTSQLFKVRFATQ